MMIFFRLTFADKFNCFKVAVTPKVNLLSLAKKPIHAFEPLVMLEMRDKISSFWHEQMH